MVTPWNDIGKSTICHCPQKMRTVNRKVYICLLFLFILKINSFVYMSVAWIFFYLFDSNFIFISEMSNCHHYLRRLICTERWFSFCKVCFLHIPTSFYSLFSVKWTTCAGNLDNADFLPFFLNQKLEKVEKRTCWNISAYLCNYPCVSRINNWVVWFHSAKHLFLFF